MASNSAGPSLAHRTLSNIRAGAVSSAAAPPTPHTPLRNIHPTYGSPSSIRAEEDVVVIEFGSRAIRVGFAGDPVPRGTVSFGPGQQRRAGDFRAWQVGYRDDWESRSAGNCWGRDYELWGADIRELDLGLVGDRIERALREAYTKYLLVDSKPRKLALVLPSSMAIPLLSTVLDTLFNCYLPPTISLLSSPTSAAVAAGVRSALVVDLDWAETIVTAVYEYREVQCNRSVRAGRMLVEQMQRLLARSIAQNRGDNHRDRPGTPDSEHVASFEECDEITSRLAWCRPAHELGTPREHAESLPTVHERDEPGPHGSERPESVSVPLRTARPPATLELSYAQLAVPCEDTFFHHQCSDASFDDHELPLHLLLHRTLLQLPVDVRAICMSRIIFTGGCSQILGLRKRAFDELALLVHERGWDPVLGKGVEQFRLNPKLKRGGHRQAAGVGPAETRSSPQPGDYGEKDGVWHDAANAAPDVDAIEDQLHKGNAPHPVVQGELRAIDSLGPWSGASLLSQLKVPAIATIDREPWLQQGASGAARPSEVDFKAQQRHSMGAGLMRSTASSTSWTLGIWGSV